MRNASTRPGGARRRVRRGMGLILTLAIGFSGVWGLSCGSDHQATNANANGRATAQDSEVRVQLSEWAITPVQQSVPAGDVALVVTNTGPKEPHDFLIIKTDLYFPNLPTNDDGSVDLFNENVELIAQLGPVPMGGTQQLTVRLESGNYALISNLVDQVDGMPVAQYGAGMRAGLTVN